MKYRKSYIEKLVEQGEHICQDFKFEISDSKKIARSIAAFSNTKGGKLLVGVKDNGSIAGIRSEEEIHMLQAAADMYCIPPVSLKFKEWEVLGKQVLEVDIQTNSDHLIQAPDKNGDYKVFIRMHDQNILANGIFIKAWERKKQALKVEIKYTEDEKNFLQEIKHQQPINWSQLRKRLDLKPARLNQMILDFMQIDIVELRISEKGYFYHLNEKQIEKNENTYQWH